MTRAKLIEFLSVTPCATIRPSMRFVQPRTEGQQCMKASHRVRESLVNDKVKTTNQMHAFLLEFGISMPKGIAVIKRLSEVISEHDLPPYLVQLLQRLHAHYLYLVGQLNEIEKEINSTLKQDEGAQRLLTIPSVGPITASLLAS